MIHGIAMMSVVVVLVVVGCGVVIAINDSWDCNDVGGGGTGGGCDG
eukprot:CAMPEP_0170941840 /NCGR_PEP_ID=MMETSP0735-20130129/23757_1 /TAXON_ID=186038 /ORGANISM="Fragilariopsis kerguelensis, Strain L26-C5" /LENGTH=45 /DNA_ID= /DNA_START= /DNA_END= /DNA_ORIENTATION=